MRVAPILVDAPNIADAAGLGSEAELGFGDEVDDLVGGQEVTGVVIENRRSVAR